MRKRSKKSSTKYIYIYPRSIHILQTVRNTRIFIKIVITISIYVFTIIIPFFSIRARRINTKYAKILILAELSSPTDDFDPLKLHSS